MSNHNFSPEGERDSSAGLATELSTTLSATLDSSRTASINSKSYFEISRVDLEKRQLLHTIQLLKLELSQKQLLLDTDRNEHASELEDLEERLSDALHERKLTQLRLESVTSSYEQELKELQQELKEGRRRQPEYVGLTDTETILEEVRKEIEEALTCIPILPKEEEEQRARQSSDLSRLAIGNYVQLRFVELTRPLQQHSDNLQRRLGLLNQQLSERRAELVSTNLMVEEERERSRQLEQQLSSVRTELGSVKMRVQEGNYKIDHFDGVKRERDALKLEVENLSTAMTQIGRSESSIKNELEKVTRELSSVKQSAELLGHDKDYLTRQTTEMSARAASLEDKLDHVTEELVAVKQEKERLLREYMSSKDEERQTFNHKLATELESLHQRTALEMEKLKAQAKEVYERESKVLSEAKDAASTERDKAVASEKAIAEKYEALMKEYHKLQGLSGRRLAEVQGELQLVRYDKDRLTLVHEDLLADHRHLQLEQEKMQKKVELVTEEVWHVKSERELQVKTLEAQLMDCRSQLEGYQKIEQELDDIVMQSAQLDHSGEAEQVLFTYGFGTSVPTNSRRRLKQSVQLARRVLQLERINSSLREELRWEGERLGRVQEELEQCRELVRCSQQPGGFLLERLKDQQEKLQHNSGMVRNMEGEVAALRDENTKLKDTKNKMSVDLERLLSHREELQTMKVWLTDGSTIHPPKHSHPHQPPPSNPTHQQPRPTMFTKQSKTSPRPLPQSSATSSS